MDEPQHSQCSRRRAGGRAAALGVAAVASVLLLAASLVGAAVRERGGVQPELVAPESLETGFILIVEDRSGMSREDSPLYVASNHAGWNPGHPAMKLTPRSDMRWQIVLPKPESAVPMEFKITRGSWETVEVNADLSDRPNRTLPKVDPSSLPAGEPPRIEIVVKKFADQRPGAATPGSADPYRPMNVTGVVKRVQVVGGGGAAAAAVRDVLVWLPPGYDDAANAERAYPVLYLQDGQNLFEAPAGVPAEWRVDETATELIEAGEVTPLIIVGVPHAGAGRVGEYMPGPELSGVEPGGDAYLAFLVGEVMPRIERAFRVKQGREHTAIGGSSMGAAIALHAAARHPERFGLVLAESLPGFAVQGRADEIAAAEADDLPIRLFLGAGGRESSDRSPNPVVVRGAQHLAGVMASRGLGNDRVCVEIDPEAAHDERAWAARFGAALRFLFPADD